MGKEERSRMEDRRKYQQSGLKSLLGLLESSAYNIIVFQAGAMGVVRETCTV
jgi:hypothetical protein